MAPANPLHPSELAALRALAEANPGHPWAHEERRLIATIDDLQERLKQAEVVIQYYADDAKWPWDQGGIARLYFEGKP